MGVGCGYSWGRRPRLCPTATTGVGGYIGGPRAAVKPPALRTNALDPATRSEPGDRFSDPRVRVESKLVGDGAARPPVAGRLVAESNRIPQDCRDGLVAERQPAVGE